ncbi:MAG: DUF2400 domain-containing protein [Bacteroides sp.]|nr:DUF2400 domain-containing protein [Roseburia sp.]MCM1346911.1 DUF2400 domain-containing protein [Bacteroides sp.]MCM1421443.1 DUF2400 domain-containing protein [Bacteroides sp.]
MTDWRITKESLDSVYAEVFDIETFKSVDPCGIVYKLMDNIGRNPSVPSTQLDIELGALFVAMISWGNRKAIRQAAERMLGDEMHWRPAHFVMSGAFEDSYKTAKNNCVYRTLNVDTFKRVCRKLRQALQGASSMEELFMGKSAKEVVAAICQWLSDAKVGTMDKSACKRVCMFIRWMTRKEAPDFHIWKSRPQSDLYAVMDVHVCQLTATLLRNKRPTWKACEELTGIFRAWDADDPLKYDVALMVLSDKIDNKNGDLI